MRTLLLATLLVLCLAAVGWAACNWDKAQYVLIVGPVEHVRYVEPINTEVTDVNDSWIFHEDRGWIADSMRSCVVWPPEESDYFRVLYFETLGGLSDYLARNFVGRAVLIDLRAGNLKRIHQSEIAEPDTVIQQRVKGYDWTVK